MAVSCWGMSGCAARVAAPVAERPVVGNQGGAWEAVLFTPGVAAALEGDGGGPEDARRDDRLRVGQTGPLLASNQWPEPLRPSIEHTRRVFISDRSETYLFFLPGRPRHRVDGHWRYERRW